MTLAQVSGSHTLSQMAGVSQASRFIPRSSILDGSNLLRSMHDAGIDLAEAHIQTLYHELHRQLYPSLQAFVDRCISTDVDFVHNRSVTTSILRYLLATSNSYTTMTSTVHIATTSKSGKSTKLIIELMDGELVETIISRREKSGASVAISSQVGSSVRCTYTHSSDFVRNLTAAEIIEQVIHAYRSLSQENMNLCNVAFMATGEPLHNYESVLMACRFIENIFKMKKGRITISTTGITPCIYNLKRDFPSAILAVFLHAPTDALRATILPENKFLIAGLFEALDHYMSKNESDLENLNYESIQRRRSVMIEYLFVDGRTSTLDCAHALGRLCKQRNLVVNLIPRLRVENGALRRTSACAVIEFKTVLLSYDVNCTIRLAAGSDLKISRVRKVALKEIYNGMTHSSSSSILEASVPREPTRKPKKELRSLHSACLTGVENGFDTLGEYKSDPKESDAISEVDHLAEILSVFNSKNSTSKTEQCSETFGGCSILHDTSHLQSYECSHVSSDQRLYDRYLSAILSGPYESSETHIATSVLHRPALIAAFRSIGIPSVAETHVDSFYEALNELNFPTLNQFRMSYNLSKVRPITEMRSRNQLPAAFLDCVQNELNGFATLTSSVLSVKRSQDKKVFRLCILLYNSCEVETLVSIYDFSGSSCATVSVSARVVPSKERSMTYSLTTSEILDQIVHASEVLRLECESPVSIRRVKIQEVGEPLLNFDNVVRACSCITTMRIWDVKMNRVTISTIGVTPRIFDLIRLFPDINIAVCLRAPTQQLRQTLIPLARRYTIDGLMEVLVYHNQRNSHLIHNGEKVVVCYTMVDDATCSLENAHELGNLCKHSGLRVHLVPYQCKGIEDSNICPSLKHIHEFTLIVKSYGIDCTVKLPQGATVIDDVKRIIVRAENSPACGKLRLEYIDKSETLIDFWKTLSKANLKRKTKQHQETGSKSHSSLSSSESPIAASRSAENVAMPQAFPFINSIVTLEEMKSRDHVDFHSSIEAMLVKMEMGRSRDQGLNALLPQEPTECCVNPKSQRSRFNCFFSDSVGAHEIDTALLVLDNRVYHILESFNSSFSENSYTAVELNGDSRKWTVAPEMRTLQSPQIHSIAKSSAMDCRIPCVVKNNYYCENAPAINSQVDDDHREAHLPNSFASGSNICVEVNTDEPRCDINLSRHDHLDSDIVAIDTSTTFQDDTSETFRAGCSTEPSHRRTLSDDSSLAGAVIRRVQEAGLVVAQEHQQMELDALAEANPLSVVETDCSLGQEGVCCYQGSMAPPAVVPSNAELETVTGHDSLFEPSFNYLARFGCTAHDAKSVDFPTGCGEGQGFALEGLSPNESTGSPKFRGCSLLTATEKARITVVSNTEDLHPSFAVHSMTSQQTNLYESFSPFSVSSRRSFASFWEVLTYSTWPERAMLTSLSSIPGASVLSTGDCFLGFVPVVEITVQNDITHDFENLY